MRARVTLHGFAINCDTDLSWFGGIVAVRPSRQRGDVAEPAAETPGDASTRSGPWCVAMWPTCSASRTKPPRTRSSCRSLMPCLRDRATLAEPCWELASVGDERVARQVFEPAERPRLAQLERPFHVAQPLDARSAPSGLGHRVDQRCGRGHARERERGEHLGAGTAAWWWSCEASAPGARHRRRACFARSAGALEPQTPSNITSRPPGAATSRQARKRADGVGHRPEHVTLDHGIERTASGAPWRTRPRTRARGPRARGLLPCLRQHAFGEIERGHGDTPAQRRAGSSEPVPAPTSRTVGRRRRQRSAQGRAPGGRFQRIGDRVRGRAVVGRGIAVPELPDAVVNVGHELARWSFRTGARRAWAGTPPRAGRRRASRRHRPWPPAPTSGSSSNAASRPSSASRQRRGPADFRAWARRSAPSSEAHPRDPDRRHDELRLRIGKQRLASERRGLPISPRPTRMRARPIAASAFCGILARGPRGSLPRPTRYRRTPRPPALPRPRPGPRWAGSSR